MSTYYVSRIYTFTKIYNQGAERMLKRKKIGFVGSGNMGEALISGLVESQAAFPENIICSDISQESLAEKKEKYGIAVTTDNVEVVTKSDIIVYAIKPQVLATVLEETADALDESKLVISIAAGIPLSAIAAGIGKQCRTIRVMPNICAFVKKSATAIVAGSNVQDRDLELAKAIFDSVGITVFLEEKLIDAFTGLSGSGPSYVFLLLDAMADAGVKMGLSRQDSLLLSAQTMMGAATMMLESGEHPAQLKDRVTSPGGTSIAGIHALEKGAVRNAVIDCVEAATLRSKELGEITRGSFKNES